MGQGVVQRWRAAFRKRRRGESELKKGDHFAAFEQPALFTQELGECFRRMRGAEPGWILVASSKRGAFCPLGVQARGCRVSSGPSTTASPSCRTAACLFSTARKADNTLSSSR